MSTKSELTEIIQALFSYYMESTDLENVYHQDGTKKWSIPEAANILQEQGLYDVRAEASQYKVEFESALDNLVQDLARVFPKVFNKNNKLILAWEECQKKLDEVYSNIGN